MNDPKNLSIAFGYPFERTADNWSFYDMLGKKLAQRDWAGSKTWWESLWIKLYKSGGLGKAKLSDYL